MKYQSHFSTRKTPQSEPIPGREQDMAKDSAGGYAFPVDDWTRLDRFLILGSEAGTYYIGEHKLTVENAQAAVRCLQADGPRTVQRVVEISQAGRAPKNDPALFVLAMAFSPRFADIETRNIAAEALPKVARIGTHLFHFADAVQHFRGWGRGLREAIAAWYNGMDAERLAYQAVKYQQREGWSHRDLLRLSHPLPPNRDHDRIYHWITQGKAKKKAPGLIHAFETAKVATDEKEIITLICEYGLTREMVPTQFLNSPAVWEALLERMPMTAMIRNLGKMNSVGLLGPMAQANAVVCQRLNSGAVRKARVHPLQVLVALKTYQRGRGLRGSLSWEPVSQVVDALDAAFYNAFDNVPATGKRWMLALDVSGSMAVAMSNLPLSCREGAAAMAMVTARSEPNYIVTVFSSAGMNFRGTGSSRHGWGQEDGLSTFDISPRERLDDIVNRTHGLPFGGTDCALPMLYAQAEGIPIDVFAIYTDSETWAGRIHPIQALQEYRRSTGIPAKLVVVGMVSNGFSIADPNDAGMMDVVGFDTATPQIIADFVE